MSAGRPPAAVLDAQAEIAAQFLTGSGIEISAREDALALPPGTWVRYLDRMPDGELRRRHPELAGADLAPVELVDDAETLSTIPDGSLDFIVADYFLQHCLDPASTIVAHLAKLRAGGILFYAVPGRPRPEARTATELTELVLGVQRRLNDEVELDTVARTGEDTILVLRRTGAGESPTAVAALPISAPPPPPAPPPQSGPGARRRTPLAGLRARLDADEAFCEWVIDPDGALGRGLVMPSGRGVAFPLRLPGPTNFTARVRLMPHDWRDGAGAVDATVLATDATGERALWSGSIATAERLGDLDGVTVQCEVPTPTRLLRLCLGPSASEERAVARAIWVEPALLGRFGARPADSELAAGVSNQRPTVVDASVEPVAGEPLISVLMPVHDPPLMMLEEAVESVLAQSFGAWELCLLDDGSRSSEIVSALTRLAARDPRIRIQSRQNGGGIADATNAALAMARGEFVALLDHDDWVSPDALAALADRIRAEPDLDMLYTDEDIVLDGAPVWVHLKPQWSLDTMRTNGYTCHLGAYRRTVVTELGGFRSAFNGSQDIDMILRLIERTERIAHVPGIHYHWRVHPDSSAGGDAKPYAYVAARRAIIEHLERSSIAARVDYGPPGLYRIVHKVPAEISVTIILALSDSSGIAEAAASLAAQPHSSWEILLVGSHAVLADAMSALRRDGVANHRIRSIICEDRHTGLDRGARAASGERLVLMQAPAAPLTEDWLVRLIGYAGQAGVAAAGPVLLGGNGRIQDAGVAVVDGWPLPLLYGTRSSMDEHFGYGTSVYDVTAVSGVLATSAHVFAELGGLRPALAELSLVDYCLRAGVGGLRSVLVPDARLQSVGHDRTMNDLGRLALIARDRQGQPDPFYNPRFRDDRGDFRRR